MADQDKEFLNSLLNYQTPTPIPYPANEDMSLIDRLKKKGVEDLNKQADPRLEANVSQAEAVLKQEAKEAKEREPQIAELSPGGPYVDMNRLNGPKTNSDLLSELYDDLTNATSRSVPALNKLFDDFRGKLDAEEAPAREVIQNLERGKFVQNLTPLLFFSDTPEQGFKLLQETQKGNIPIDEAIVKLKMDLVDRRNKLEEVRTKTLVGIEQDKIQALMDAVKNKMKDKSDQRAAEKTTKYVEDAYNSYKKSTEKDREGIKVLSGLISQIESTKGDRSAWTDSAFQNQFARGVNREVGALSDSDIKRAKGDQSYTNKVASFLNGQITGEQLTDEDVENLRRFVVRVREIQSEALRASARSEAAAFSRRHPEIDQEYAFRNIYDPEIHLGDFEPDNYKQQVNQMNLTKAPVSGVQTIKRIVGQPGKSAPLAKEKKSIDDEIREAEQKMKERKK